MYYIYIHIYIYIYIYIYKYIHTCINAHIYIHIYMYKYLVWYASPCLLTKFLINIYSTICDINVHSFFCRDVILLRP